ncbi:signal-transducing adaptor protein 1-like [Arapaima gigas]
MASPRLRARAGRTRAQLPPCYYEGYLEKRTSRDTVSQRLWTCLCGNALFFYNSTKDTTYTEKLDLSSFVSLTDDDTRDKNLEAARLTLRLKDREVKLTAPSLEARELWKGFICSVVELCVPSSLNLLPGQIYMLKEVVERERERRRRKPPPTHPAPAVPLYLPLVGEIPPCFQPVSRTEAEVLLERHPDCGNLLLRPGRDGSSLAVTTRQDLHGSVFRHYRITQKQDGGYLIEVENPAALIIWHRGRRGSQRQNNSSPSPARHSSLSDDRRAQKPLPPPPDPQGSDSSESSSQMNQLSQAADTLAQVISEELKFKLETRRGSQH